ncbi:AAA family ATPase [Algicola sagamiensis]|uniref:AAA family ATPase n=1 Tax=Algicola sagamiensis TaxID=163869 RepID=UPI0004772574
MRLKQIKLSGFKSFVDPTVIPFPDQMTGIVGPNGCGKSNVIDAVRWVLGESSAKTLRGESMTDVIFNGSSTRKPVSQASVELRFDQIEGQLSGTLADRSEISIRRVVTREGQSTYFLNGSACRRRDITDIFLGTGLGPRSYAIIEQGMISRLIESKPQELRSFIEEAAGISKYKERRRETENRIRHTRDNLDRLMDVREELNQQVEKLESQCESAQEYTTLKATERQLKLELSVMAWDKFSRQAQRLDEQLKEKEQQRLHWEDERLQDEAQRLVLKEQKSELQYLLQQQQEQFYQLGNDVARWEQVSQHTRERTQHLNESLDSLTQQLAELNQQEKQLKDSQRGVDQQLRVGQPQLDEKRETVAETEAMLAENESVHLEAAEQYEQARQLFTQYEKEHAHTRAEANRHQALLERTQQQLEQLGLDLVQISTDGDTSFQAYPQKIESLKETIEVQTQQLIDHKNKQADLEVSTQAFQQQLDDTKEQRHQVTAELLALQKIIEEKTTQDAQFQQWLKDSGLSATAFCEQLVVASGWEQAFETLMQPFAKALVLSEKPAQLPDMSCQLIFPSESPGSSNRLLSKIISGQYPALWQYIEAVETQQEAQDSLSNPDTHSVLVKTGEWVGKNWLVRGSNSESGLLHQVRRKKVLDEERLALTKQQHDIETNLNQLILELKQEQQLYEARTQEVSALKTQLATIRAEYQLYCQQQEKATQQHSRYQAEFERAQQRQTDELKALETCENQVSVLEEKFTQQKATMAELYEAKEQKAAQQRRLREQNEQVKQHLHKAILHIEGLKTQARHLAEKTEQLTQQRIAMRNQRDGLEIERKALNQPDDNQDEVLSIMVESRLKLESQMTEKKQQLNLLESNLAQLQQKDQDRYENIQNLRQWIESKRLERERHRVNAENAKLRLGDQVQNLEPVRQSLPDGASEARWKAKLDQVTAQVEALGPINLAAIEDYKAHSQRKAFLDEQHTDLSSALDVLENAIRKIDKESRARFKETFDKVNGDLQHLFPKVFGGGQAYLALTDSDLLEAGVTIMAQPPGKKNSSIQLLSGGEKALTALSLVFAIFQLNPAPFCLLDEVDAPLDDANVGRFCNLVQEMSNTVQFIYISHNKIAMEMATHLCGVTMHEPGVSRMVSVDVQQAVELAEAS